jgi:putative endonuclease
MSETTRERGSRGEDQAVDFLLEKGYRVLQRNYRYGNGEIDIVAVDGITLVFVEVKLRSTDAFGDPEEAVTPRKQRQIRMAAEGYLTEHAIEDCECRCDVIAIRAPRGGHASIRHIENAF